MRDKKSVRCLYLHACVYYYKYMRACERDGCLCVALSSPLCCGFAVFILCYDCFYIVPSLLLCPFCCCVGVGLWLLCVVVLLLQESTITPFMSVFLLFASYFWMNFKANLLFLSWNFFIPASNSYLSRIKWGRFCIVFTPILCSKRGELTIFCRCNLNLIEVQKQCNFSLKRQKMTCFSHKSIKN